MRVWHAWMCAALASVAVAAPDVAFHKACASNDVKTVVSILKVAPGVLNEIGPEGGQTCLMRAVLFGAKGVVTYLLSSTNVDVTIGEKDGYTPLHGAGFQGRAEIAKILIAHGLDPLHQHEDGYAPIHRAAWGGERRHTETVYAFLNAGVPADLKAGDGRTALEMTHSPATVRVLTEHGASGGGLSKESFLGVGNTECIGSHLGYAALLCAIIVLLSFIMDVVIEFIRRKITCPQMMRVANRFFEELMVMGVISMCIFAFNTSGVINQLSFVVSGLNPSQLLHFQEFFHYVVFMTAVYYICIMVVLIVIATVVPRYLYDRQHPNDAARNDDTADDFPLESPSRYNASSQTNGGGGRMSHRRYQRQHSGYDFVNGSRMYYFLRQRYKREGWSFRFNLVKQFALWKSFEVLAYNVCQYRSGYLYKNPAEMQRIFNLSVRASHAVDFGRFNTLCTRNMLATLTKLHYSAFFILVLLVMATGLLHATSIYLYMAFAALLCAMNFVIMIKTLRILKGIVKDRLRIFSLDDIERMLPPSSTALVSPPRHAPRKPPSLKVVAQLVRALVRMQMSVLCHRQLHSHDARFWLRSPAFLLRLFQFATTGHAFYLVWLTLVVAHDPLVLPWMYFLMLTFPILSMLVITPLTMPSLVLVMSLTGFFVEQNPSSHDDATTSFNLLSAKDRIRVARRYLSLNS
ncbi:hypothetical protein DYB25_007555 [Aphanomyces astaci]|uniref:Uncharacterized protein n=1 Tax=Aphanomyces astaci TaxID=112090 RepID=A0A396ZXX8_APHAT|nr:hypothetical protein DYB25_007555 [Aphanomyces astaci]